MLIINLEEKISNIFENNNYSDLFKIRWLYLYLCKIFSYDTRFIYAKDDLKEEIYNKSINIKNIEDFEIVCYTIANILVDTLTQYGYKCEIIKEYPFKFTHAYVVVHCKDYIIKLDPTKRHDLTRVKINSNTLDFTLLNDNINFKEDLYETNKLITHNYNDIDKNIFYDNKTILKLVQIIEESGRKRNLTECELFFEKIEYLFSLINTRTDLIRYDDMDYYFSYLIKKFKINEKIIDGKTKKISRIKPAIFFKNSDIRMKDIINISIIEYENLPPMFYIFKKEKDNFKTREIYKNEAIELLKQYHNPLCQFIFENKATKLIKK